MVAFDAQFLWNGLVVGSLIAVSALGLTLIFGVLDFINIAYGDYMALGAYVAFAGNAQLDLPLVVAGVLGVVATGVAAVAFDKLVFEHFRDRDPIVLLVVSIGLAFMLRNAIRIGWGTGSRQFAVPVEAGTEVLGAIVLVDQVVIILVSFLILGVTF